MVCGATDSHQPPTPLIAPASNPVYYVPEQQPVSQVPAGGAPLYGPQPRAYGQGSTLGPWQTPNINHMSATPQLADHSKPTLRQRLIHMFRLPTGHASTITESPSPRHVSRAASPHPTSASRRNTPSLPHTRQSARSARAGHRRSARTVSPGPRRSMHSYRCASPRPRPRSQSPYVYRKAPRYRFSPDDSSSSRSTLSSSSGLCSSTEAVIRGRSRASDRA